MPSKSTAACTVLTVHPGCLLLLSPALALSGPHTMHMWLPAQSNLRPWKQTMRSTSSCWLVMTAPCSGISPSSRVTCDDWCGWEADVGTGEVTCRCFWEGWFWLHLQVDEVSGHLQKIPQWCSQLQGEHGEKAAEQVQWLDAGLQESLEEEKAALAFPYVHALNLFNKVVESCFGQDLKWWLTRLDNGPLSVQSFELAQFPTRVPKQTACTKVGWKVCTQKIRYKWWKSFTRNPGHPLATANDRIVLGASTSTLYKF